MIARIYAYPYPLVGESHLFIKMKGERHAIFCRLEALKQDYPNMVFTADVDFPNWY